MVVDHEPQRVRDVALERHESRAVEQVPERDLAALERASHFRVRLEVPDGDLEERADVVTLVTPQGALVVHDDRVNRFHAGKEVGLWGIKGSQGECGGRGQGYER